MADYPWYSSYPAGIAHDIDPDVYPNIPAILDEAARRFPGRTGYSNMGTGLTYQEAAELSKDLAAYLQRLPDMKPGDRIAIMMPNLLQYVVSVFAVLRAGFIVVNVNPLYTAREVEHTLKDSGAKAIIIIENFAKTLERAIPGTACRHIVTTAVGDLLPFPKRQLVNFIVRRVKKLVPSYSLQNAVSLREAISQGRAAGFQPVNVKREDIAFLQYTGGTTGIAKGAELTHRNVIANIEQIGAWISSTFKQGEEVVLTALPLYHIFSDRNARLHKLGGDHGAHHGPPRH